MRLDPEGRGAVYITIVNVVHNDDDNEFVDVAFFLQLFSLKIDLLGVDFDVVAGKVRLEQIVQ